VAEVIVMFPLTVVVVRPPITVKGSSSEVDEADMDAVVFGELVLADKRDIVPVAKVLASKSDNESVGLASAPVVTTSDPVRVMTSWEDS
jgi:hypothetical protein